MPTVTLDLGPSAVGWEVYLTVWAPGGYVSVWTGVAFDIPTSAAFESGSVTGIDAGGVGLFTFEFPPEITEAGTYPIRVYRSLGVVERDPTDQQLTPDIPDNSVTITGAAVEEATSFSYDVDNPSVIPYGDAEVIAIGEGRDVIFTPIVVPDDPTSADDWSVVYTGFGMETPLTFTSGDATYPLTVDEDLWTIQAGVTPTHTALFSPATWGTIDLWHTPGGNDAAVMRRKLARTVS